MKRIAFLFTLLSILSCNKDSLLDQSSIKKSKFDNLLLLKNWYISDYTNKNADNNENFIKSNAVNSLEEKLKIIEINWTLTYLNHDSANIKSYTTPIIFDNKTGENIELVTSVKDENVKGVFIKYIPDSSYFLIHKNPGQLINFSGIIKIYNKSGDFLKSFYFKNGQKIDNNIAKATTKSFLECDNCTLPEVIVTSTYSLYNNNNHYYIMIFYIDFTSDLTPIFAGGTNIYAGLVESIDINIKNPCISSVWDNIYSNAKQSQVMSYINSQFGFNENCNLNINDVPNLTNKYSHEVLGLTNYSRGNGSLTVNISLNSSTDQTQESIAATILHELIHGYIASQNIFQTSEEAISNITYVNWMASSLMSLYPNLSITDANALSLAGLENTSYYNSLDKSLTDSYKLISTNYEAGNLGTKCK